MPKARLLATVRLFFGVLTLAAIITQILHLRDLDVFYSVNFFSYFTNLSNIFAAIMLVSAAYTFAIGHKTGPIYDIVRGTSVMCMVVVGIVYSLLLSGEDVGALLSWVNVWLHYLMPVVILADWLIWPPKTKLRTESLIFWLIFPVVYFAYTLVRGEIVAWYPYRFMNPSQVGGYIGVTGYCVLIATAFAGCGWLLIKYTNMAAIARLGMARNQASAPAKLKKRKHRP